MSAQCLPSLPSITDKKPGRANYRQRWPTSEIQKVQHGCTYYHDHQPILTPFPVKMITEMPKKKKKKRKGSMMNERAAPLGNKQLFFVFLFFLASRVQETTATNSQQQLAT